MDPRVRVEFQNTRRRKSKANPTDRPTGGFRVAWSVPPALPGPKEPDHGGGLDHGDGIGPAAPQAGQQDQEEPVGGPQPWTRSGALEDGQLVPQREVFEH